MKGGKRPGAGRKNLPLVEKKKRVTISLKPDLIAKLKGENKNRLIERLLIEYFERNEKMSQLNQIQANIQRCLTNLHFFDAADLDDVNIITTCSTGNMKDAHNIHIESGTVVNGQFEGKDTEGRNIHLPIEYIINIS